MKLEDALATKAELLRTTRASLESELAESGGVTTRRLDDVQAVRRSVAIGIAPAHDGFRVAVRLQRREFADKVVTDAMNLAGDEVDVRYIGRIAKFNQWQSRTRPLRIGLSVAHFAVTAGTLGAFVRRDGENRLMILSNNHVFADENRGRPGDSVLQPSSYDRGVDPDDRIGELHSFVPVDPASVNSVDAALAALDPDVDAERLRLGDDTLLAGATTDPSAVVDVKKTGRTTGHTAGRVTAFSVDNIVVKFDIGNVQFDGQIEIEGAGSASFSQGGDSGSLIVSSSNHAVGLLFAGGDQGGANGMGLTYANPIGEVLTALDVSLAT